MLAHLKSVTTIHLQLVAACQFVYEEKYITKYDVHPLKVTKRNNSSANPSKFPMGLFLSDSKAETIVLLCLTTLYEAFKRKLIEIL